LRGKGHKCGYVTEHRWVCLAATAGKKSVRSGNGRPLIATHRLILVLVSTPLRIVNRCYAGFPVSGGN